MERSRGASLILPFALLGLCGGWMATFQIIGGLWPLGLTTPFSAALLGAWLRSPERCAPARVTLATVMAGMLNGVLALLLIGSGGGHLSTLGTLPIALYFGFIFSLPFVPATVAVAFVARRVGRARAGSLIDGADRRAVWRMVATVIALGAAAMSTHPIRNGLIELTLAMTLVALALLAFDGRAMSWFRRWAQQAGRERDPMRLISAPVIDLGIGEQLFEEIAPARGPYREADRVLTVVRGDPARTRVALRSGLTGGALSLGLCGAATAYQLLWICFHVRY